jgi:pimeloyl-ACP methyl ester carboxylesterase
VVGIHTAVRAPRSVRALALLDGGYLDPRDSPDYDPSLDLATRTAELRAQPEQGKSWDATPEVIAAVMEGSDREPPTDILPKLNASRIPILLLRATEPREHEPVRSRALARFQRALPHADVIAIAGAGHDLLVEAGSAVVPILLDWFERA